MNDAAMNGVKRLSNAAKLNVTGIVVTAAGMLLQIVAGSELSHVCRADRPRSR